MTIHDTSHGVFAPGAARPVADSGLTAKLSQSSMLQACADGAQPPLGGIRATAASTGGTTMKRLLTIAAAVGFALSAGVAADAADRTVKIAGFGAKSGVVPLVRHQHRSRNARRRQGDQRGGRGEACRRLDGADGSLVRRRPLQRRGRHFGDPPDRLERRRGRRGPDLLECRRTALRHPPGEGRRRGRQRAAVPDLHRHRDQGRAGEDFGMGVPATSRTKARCTRPCSSGWPPSIRMPSPSMAVSRRTSPHSRFTWYKVIEDALGRGRL